mgnify:CR=1 FL=1
MAQITLFRGDFAFLSNFQKCLVEFDGDIYPTVEHAFQAAKTFDKEDRKKILAVASPVTAKRIGRRVALREDWETVKCDIMLELLKSKFTDSELKEKLLATGEAELIEGNNHGDRFWGRVNGEGMNMLGKLLMDVRKSLQGE